MDYAKHANFINAALVGFKQMTDYQFDHICGLEESSRLAITERKSVHAIKFAAMHMRRLYNTITYLMNPNSNINPQKVESYDINSMIKEIVSQFERMTSTCVPLSINYTSRLKGTSIITLSKIHFEFIMLNLLYSCIKATPGTQPGSVKITVSVSETNDHIVFHIYDSNKHFKPDEFDKLLSDESLFENTKDDSTSNFIALAVRVAQKSASDMKGKLTVSALKGSTRYDIYLPKHADVPMYKMCSPTRYIPTYEYYNEILADIKLEHILTRVIESFEGEFDGVKII